MWPVSISGLTGCSFEDLFSLLEFIFDHVSKGTEGTMHSFNDCGMHWEKFDAGPAQAEYVHLVNRLLLRIEPGYEMNEDGEIRLRTDPGMHELLSNAPLAVSARDRDEVVQAIARFRSRTSSWDIRRDAVVALAGVLERNRAKIKAKMLSKDEDDLFNIANNFSLRHKNDKQRSDYDSHIWLTWMFYVYLATIALVHRLSDRASE
jgi:hypothetical protein